jgi:hypothetical protein
MPQPSMKVAGYSDHSAMTATAPNRMPPDQTCVVRPQISRCQMTRYMSYSRDEWRCAASDSLGRRTRPAVDMSDIDAVVCTARKDAQYLGWGHYLCDGIIIVSPLK